MLIEDFVISGSTRNNQYFIEVSMSLLTDSYSDVVLLVWKNEAGNSVLIHSHIMVNTSEDPNKLFQFYLAKFNLREAHLWW